MSSRLSEEEYGCELNYPYYGVYDGIRTEGC